MFYHVTIGYGESYSFSDFNIASAFVKTALDHMDDSKRIEIKRVKEEGDEA